MSWQKYLPSNGYWTGRSNLYKDDKKVDYDICMETFTCIKLDKGSYNIKLRYIPQGFIVGLIISLSSLIITVIYTKKK